MRNILVALTLTVGLLVGGWVTSSRVSAKRQPPKGDVSMALREGGLHAAAKAAGGFYNRIMPAASEVVVPDLTSLARVSEEVVAGQVTGNESHLGPGGKYITTDYRLIIDDAFQGTLKKHDEVVLSVLGGRVEFGDGTAAQVSTPQFQRPMDGEKLVLFLREVRPENVSLELRAFAKDRRVFNAVLGGIGAFEIPDDESAKVKPKGRSTDPVSRESRKKGRTPFLHDVKQAVQEAKRLGPHGGGVDPALRRQ